MLAEASKGGVGESTELMPLQGPAADEVVLSIKRTHYADARTWLHGRKAMGLASHLVTMRLG